MSTARTGKASDKSSKGAKSKATLAQAAKLTQLPEQPITDEQRAAETEQAQHRRASDQAMANIVQTMTTPAVPATSPTSPTSPVALQTPVEVAAEFASELEKLAARFGMPLAAVNVGGAKTARAPKADRERRNDITRPGATTVCGKIWAAADDLLAKGTLTVPALKAYPGLKNINDHTLKTQYARWRQFNGVKGRQSVVSVKQEPAEYLTGVIESNIL